MKRGVNKVILLGNCVRDVEMRSMPNGNQVVSLSIATSESWVDKDTKEKQERAEFHNCVCFGKLAEIIAQYVKKGSKLYLEGSLKTRSWEKDGVKQYATEIVISEMQMLDGKTQESSQPSQGRAAQSAPFADFDDDLPF